MISARGYFWRYALLALPLAFAGIPIYIHAPDYYLRQGSLGLAVVGASLFLVRLVDAFLDPLFGWLADHKPEWRMPSVIIGSLILVVGFALLFSPLGLNSLIWFCLTLILVTAGYSVLTIQMNSLGAIWSSRSWFQIRITSLRESLAISGLVLAAAAPAILQFWLAERYAYLVLASILLVLMLVAVPVFLSWYKHLSSSFTSSSRSGENTAPAGRVPAAFFGVYSLSVLASSIPVVLVIFFIRDRLDLEPYTGLFLAIYFLSGIAGMPLWRLIARRWGHLHAWQVAMALACCSFVWAFWLVPGSLVQYLMVCFFSGVALGGELCLPPALLSSLIHRHNAQLKASRYFAACSFITKVALAVGAGLTLPILQWMDFVPGGVNAEPVLQGVAVLYALVPSFLKVCALALSVFLFRSETAKYELSKNIRRIRRGKLHAV